MVKVQNGQTEALGLLYERYKRLLFSFFYQMTKEASQSEDLVQNVFYRVLKYKNQYQGKGTFKSWIFTIARNAFTDEYRKLKKKKTTALDVYNNYYIEHENVETKIDQQERSELLQKALSTLDDEKRELIVMIKLNEMKYREVAEIMDMNESTVKVKVFRIMKELQSNYQTLLKVQYER